MNPMAPGAPPVKRKPGRPAKAPEDRVQEYSFYATPFVRKCLAYVEQEERNKGSRLSKSEIVRRIIQLGIETYRQLGELPRRER